MNAFFYAWAKGPCLPQNIPKNRVFRLPRRLTTNQESFWRGFVLERRTPFISYILNASPSSLSESQLHLRTHKHATKQRIQGIDPNFHRWNKNVSISDGLDTKWEYLKEREPSVFFVAMLMLNCDVWRSLCIMEFGVMDNWVISWNKVVEKSVRKETVMRFC